MGTGQRRITRAFLPAAAIALVLPAVAVAWLGALLLQSDRELDRQRVQERLASAATLVIGSLDSAFSHAERRLSAVATSEDHARAEAAAAFGLAPDDGSVVVLSPGATWSSAPLVYVRDEPVFVDDAGLTFASTEQLEFAKEDLQSALGTYRAMARTGDLATRAGALARAGRVARRLGQHDAALTAYGELATMGKTLALGRPADLVAALERCAVLRDAGDAARLGAEAAALDAQLVAGHWRLSRSQFTFYRSGVREWLGGRETSRERDAAAARGALVAEGVDVVRRVAGAAAGAGGRLAFDGEHGRGLVVWQRAGERVTALVATATFVERTWLSDVRDVATAQRARVSLVAESGQLATEATGGTAPHGSGPSSERRSTEWLDSGLPDTALRRSAADTGLPFTVRVASADPEGDVSTFAGRRRLLAGLVTALALLVLGSGYVAVRGVVREMAVARLQSDFVAAVSHEFRTPVASVRQLTELLEEGRVQDEAKRLEYYGRIRRQAVRLQHLVENLLDFGRMESSATEYRMAPLDPAALVRDVAAEFEGTVRGTARHVDVVVPASLPTVVADREALGRAVWNLLDNAAKYSPPEAPIVLETETRARGLTIHVRDRGPGIPADEQARIFDKFVRGANARESGAKGTGLGLAMVRHIVRAHGGDVRVASVAGAGSTFTILLPAGDTTA